MSNLITRNFIDNCSTTANPLHQMLAHPHETLKKMNYVLPEYVEAASDNQYGAHSSTTLAAQSASAGAEMAGISPSVM